jgi:hypothetical protein
MAYFALSRPLVVPAIQRPIWGRALDRLHSGAMLLAVIALLPVLFVKDRRRRRREGRGILDD